VNLIQKKLTREYLFFSAIALAVVLVGVYTGVFTYKYIHEDEIVDIERRAKTIATFISPLEITSLSISESDILNPTYQTLKDRLVQTRSFYDDVRFIYIITERSGAIYFVADSESPDSPDYSPPGQEYEEASIGVKQALEGKVVIEGPIRDRWGSWISSLVPIKDARGVTVAIVGIDIDARAHTAHLYTSMAFVFMATLLLLFLLYIIFRTRRKEKEIIELKSEFISLASHEIRSPLTFIRWKISTLIESTDISEDTRKALFQIKDALLRLITMSNSILETTATDYKVLNKKDFQPMAIAPIILSAVKSVEGARLQKNISIEFGEKNTKDIFLPVEYDKLELVFINILSNAIKYSPENSRVNIEARETKVDVTISIKDSGVGIPAGEVKNIFSGFYRADNVKNSGVRGSGFGLYMTKKIVEFLGGVIKCISKEGEGTTFIISFAKNTLTTLSQ